MAILVFCAVLALSVLMANLVIIQPLHILQFFHVPQLVTWGVVLVLFAWLFGDDSSPWA